MSTGAKFVTTTTNSVSETVLVIGLNTKYLKTVPGILKLLELILGVICVCIAGYEVDKYYHNTSLLYFFVIAVTFFIGTFISIIAYITSIATSLIMSKTTHEIIYNFIAFVLIITSSIIVISKGNIRFNLGGAGIIGCLLSALYLTSGILSIRK